MVNSSAALDATFAALADPTRRAIVAHLARRPQSSVGEIARPFDVSLPAISKHLRVLERAGLLAREKDGRIHRCRLVPEPMDGAAEWIDRHRKFWEGRLDALQRFLESGEDEKEVESWKRRRRRKTVSESRGRSAPRGSGSSGRGRNPS
jgi:DNA-binding transcriptional ArsR family regulator